MRAVLGRADASNRRVRSVDIRREERLEVLAYGVVLGKVAREVAGWVLAVAVARVRRPLDLLLEEHQSLKERLRPGRAAGDVDVDGDDEVYAGKRAVPIGEGPADGGT